MQKKRTILFNLSGFKCATTWLSECFKSGRGAYSNYSTPYFSKFFPVPDIRRAREGYINRKIIYNARLRATLENLRTEDQLFMEKMKSHEFNNIDNTDEVALELIRLIEDYKGDIIYLGDPNIHFWMGSYFDTSAQKSINGEFALANYLNSLRSYGYEPRFLLIARSLLDQYKSYLKMILLDEKSVNLDDARRQLYDQILGLSEEAMLKTRIQDTIKIMAVNPLYALHCLGKQKGLNIDVDVFSFDSIQDSPKRIIESIANTYSIQNFHHNKSVSDVVNKSKAYEARDAEMIDKLAKRILYSDNCSSEVSIIKNLEQFVFKRLSESQQYLPTKISLNSFGIFDPV